MQGRSDRALRDLEEGRLFTPPHIARWLVVTAAVIAAGAILLVATGHVEDWGAVLLSLALAAIVIPILVVFLYLQGRHLIFMLLLPIELVVSTIDTRKERGRQREYAVSLAGSAPVNVSAPNADRALGWGLASLIFPPVGFVGIWYGRDALNFIRLSGGALAGERKARAGVVLGVIGTLELALLFALLAMVPVSPQ